METKVQIIVATVTAFLGIVIGASLILFAVLYRQRLLKKSKGLTVNYRKHNRNSRTEDRVSINFRQGNSGKYDNFTFAYNGSQPSSWENLSEINIRPKLHQASWKQRSSRNNEYKTTKRQILSNDNQQEIYEDFSAPRKSSTQRQSSRQNSNLNSCVGEELVTVLRRHSDSLELRQIPRPNVRPYKSELFENIESVYDHINLQRNT